MPDTRHYACFECRKGFKRRDAWTRNPLPTARCPQCGKPMSLMGRAFRAPRHNDRVQWRKVERLRQAGIFFRGAECQTMELLPRTPKDVGTFLRKIQPKTQGRREIERSDRGRRSRKGRAQVPPPVRFLPERDAAPFARKTFKRLKIGAPGKGIDLPLAGTCGAKVTLAWRKGPSLFLSRIDLPRHVLLNNQDPGILPHELRPGDWLQLGLACFVIDW